MIHIAIVDDERFFVDDIETRVTKILMEEQDVEYRIHKYINPLDLLQDLNKIKYSIILLDIDMNGIDGIDISKEISEICHDALILFVTSQEKRIYDAFGINVLGFISKNRMHSELKIKLLEAIKIMREAKGVIFKTTEGNIIIPKKDIVYITLMNRKMYLYMEEKHIQIYYKVLADVKKMLDDSFIMPSRGYIVNIKNIEKYTKQYIIMIDKAHTRIEISRNKAANVIQKLIEFHLHKG